MAEAHILCTNPISPTNPETFSGLEVSPKSQKTEKILFLYRLSKKHIAFAIPQLDEFIKSK